MNQINIYTIPFSTHWHFLTEKEILYIMWRDFLEWIIAEQTTEEQKPNWKASNSETNKIRSIFVGIFWYFRTKIFININKCAVPNETYTNTFSSIFVFVCFSAFFSFFLLISHGTCPIMLKSIRIIKKKPAWKKHVHISPHQFENGLLSQNYFETIRFFSNFHLS